MKEANQHAGVNKLTIWNVFKKKESTGKPNTQTGLEDKDNNTKINLIRKGTPPDNEAHHILSHGGSLLFFDDVTADGRSEVYGTLWKIWFYLICLF